MTVDPPLDQLGPRLIVQRPHEHPHQRRPRPRREVSDELALDLEQVEQHDERRRADLRRHVGVVPQETAERLEHVRMPRPQPQPYRPHRAVALGVQLAGCDELGERSVQRIDRLEPLRLVRGRREDGEQVGQSLDVALERRDASLLALCRLVRAASEATLAGARARSERGRSGGHARDVK